jgi:hypothetical protein
MLNLYATLTLSQSSTIMESVSVLSHILDLTARNVKLVSNQRSKTTSHPRMLKIRNILSVRLTTITSLMLFATHMARLKDKEASLQSKD